ncbi:YhfC family intramembrane metalloprotease [Clostridium sp. YIM B02505]|uniref:YhfC family intramembrane metalloprotease n=1 Tax=Clostridium yunnanense TaxID=2800325 RepID=A0ABS1EKH1_9CLOT|nr:YhfC family glutamic-type intramembrane protease [Clostridium yunnanense]MBK1809871.1 YhfC family intramembrane metalloprotease [Clostridium yunnanense]
MVSNSVIISLVVVMVLCFAVPIGTLIFFKIKERFSIKTTFVGILGFVLFSLVLEQFMHKAVISSKILTVGTLGFGIYGALAAGVFEEVGRFVMFKTLLKKNREWKDGIGYAIGHGGIEAILIGGLSMLNSLIIALAVNSSTLGVLLKGQSASVVDTVKSSVVNATASGVALGGAERVFAFIIQIALTFIVLYGIRQRKNIYLLIAILLHALVDLAPALYQSKIITSVAVIEVLLCIFAVIGLVFIVKSKKMFESAKLND